MKIFSSPVFLHHKHRIDKNITLEFKLEFTLEITMEITVVSFLCKIHWSVVFCVKIYWLTRDTHSLLSKHVV